MKICHVIESAAAGSAGVMLTLAELGIAAGHDITIVYSPLRASEQFLERARLLTKARWIPLKMHRAVGAHDLLAMAKLRKVLRQGQFDIVHSHSSKAGALSRMAGAFGSSVQIYSPHGFVTMGGDSSPAFGAIERFLSRFGSAIVAVSKKEYDHALSIGIEPSKLMIIPNGISRDLVAKPFRSPSAAEHFTVGFVGRFCDQKDPILAVRAFRELCNTRPDSRLIMVGGGELDGEVRAAIRSLDLEDKVELPGACSALPLYPQFNALLCASRYEGMPVTFLEALANGVPIVSTDVGGVDELIDAGQTGFVAESSAVSLGAKLAALASLGADKRSELRAHSLDKARAFSAQVMFNRTTDLYRRCLDRSRPGKLRSLAIAKRPIKAVVMRRADRS